MAHPADRLIEAIEAKNAPVCVGIDPVFERLPGELRINGTPNDATAAQAIKLFCNDVLEAVAPHVPAVKFQSACFERYHAPGIDVLYQVMAKARSLGLVVIYDGKRGDIGVTAEHYAAAVKDSADWVTANSYLGEDGLTPFLDAGLGAFALVRTSNPSGATIQEEKLSTGETVAEHVAALMNDLSKKYIGPTGTSALGAVVGATNPQSAARLRTLMPNQMFLVPGYGAQGGGVNDVLPCFETGGRNAIITASRSVLYAFQKNGPSDWKTAVGGAARRFADEVAQGLKETVQK